MEPALTLRALGLPRPDPAGERGGRQVQLGVRTAPPVRSSSKDQPYGPCFELLGELSSVPVVPPCLIPFWPSYPPLGRCPPNRIKLDLRSPDHTTLSRRGRHLDGHASGRFTARRPSSHHRQHGAYRLLARVNGLLRNMEAVARVGGRNSMWVLITPV